MKIALIQQIAGNNRLENQKKGILALDRAASAGAQVACFAELGFERFYPQYPATAKSLQMARPLDEAFLGSFRQKAIQYGMVIILNMFEKKGNDNYDSSPMIDADGSLLGVTRMTHITEYAGFHEQGYYTPAESGPPVFQTKYGRIGVAICYDRHYPEYMRALARQSADVVFIPQAGTVGEWPDGLYEAEMRVAAFQNGYYTALCNRVGPEEALTFSGGSFVCNPGGEVIARGNTEGDDIVLVDLDLQAVEQSHARRLFFRDSRPNLYADWLK